MKDRHEHPEAEGVEQTQPEQEAPRAEQAKEPVQEPGPQLQKDTAASPPSRELQQLRERLGALQGDRDELFGRLQRLSADYSNYQKRVHKQIADAVAHEREKVVRTLLPVCDNFEMTIKTADASGNIEAILAGIRIVYDQILEVLKSHDVEPIKTVDQPFDPSLHQALLQRSDPDRKDNLVLEECQKGYTLAGRVLRPSKVIVNRAPAPPAPSQPEPDADEPSEEDALDVE
jgi:molecular chaperone GrpE